MKNEILTEVIKGVKGLATHLRCSTTKAQEILNDRILQDKGIAYRTEKTWNINVERLDALLKENPEIFYKRNK